MDGFAVLWEYEIRTGAEQEFLRHYEPRGSWAALFARAEGYRETVLLVETGRPRTYVTLDRWVSEDAYRSFRARFAAEYEALDAACERLTVRETGRGTYRDLGA